MTQFVSHIPVDVQVTRPVRPHHIDIKEHHHKSDSNASFLRAARAGNLEKILEYLKGSIDINTSNANGLNALHLAAKEGHVAIVQELVKKGANVNAATKKGNTALHIASLAGQEEVAKILIKGGANPNVQSQNGFTPLYMAAQENHDNVVKLLLANGANQSLATEDGFTPLAVALQQGHDKVVAVLLENDAKGRVRLPALHIAAKKDDCKAAALLLQNDHDPDVTSKSGFTPLHIAAHYGNENIAALLLDKNADVNYSAKHQITPLHVAAKWGKSNMVTLLIDKGAKIDAATRDGLTPLHCAARSGHDQVVDLLLEKGAPITAKTKNGLAPLHMASQGDHVDSARILLYHKAPVDDVTVDYLTALHVAAHCGHVRVAKLLLDRKADPNARALNGFTPLHIACKKNRIKVVELLLKHGASIEATTESGLTPLHVASFMGCMNIVIYLIQHGANPDVPTVRGETPLHLAARANQSDIIRILLRNGAHVDASAREQQTPLHIAARLGNVDIVGLLLQHGAAVDATTKDMYTALHIAAKEGQEEVASVLLDHGASLTATTKKGFTPLHLAAKYGNIKVARLLLQKDAPVDAQGKNGVTPLHVAAHYDHVNVALLLLDKGAFPHATAKNGYTPLHIAAKKNQMDIATTLLEYGAKPSAESKAGFTPLHLAAQEGHSDMTTLLIEHHADVNAPAKNGLTPLHLCAQEDKVNVAAILVKNGAKVDPPTKAGYTPLHVACHFGQINMIRFLLQHGADVNATTSHGYTPLHQAAQQGHTLIINLLLEHKASPNTTTNQGQTALSIAQRLGYISVVETLKIVTETIVTTTTTTITEEKYKVVAPETMQETFMSDSEDEGGDDIEDTSLYGKPAHATHVYLPYIEGQKLLMTEDQMMGDQSLHYMTTDELKALHDDNTLGIDVTRDEREHGSSTLIAPLTAEEDHLTPQHVVHQEATFSSSMAPDNVDLARAPVHAGKLKWKTFLVSFMVDARGGAMRGCRHSGVRVIIPPRRAPMPMRITCRYLRKEKLAYPPPLMEGEACASRILEVGPSGAKFLGPVIIEVPHFASLRGREREITILRSDNGETWREHSLEASDDAVHDVFNESFEGEELTAIEDLSTNRITRILTTDFPQYFAIITRIRQEVHAIGPEGGMVSSTVIPQVQAIFPEGALTKKIKVGLQAQPITPELVTKLLGNRVAVSPIVTVEPRRRKFHKPITLTIPVPQAATKGMINQYSGDAPTLRLLCSITGSTKTGGTTKAQWEDVTGSTPLTFVNDCVSFTTTVSARFWLMDCRQVNEATKFATELYREAIHVPFMAKFVVFAKRRDPLEAQLRVFCMTDDKEDKTLESQEHFTEVAKSRDVEVLEGKLQYLEFAGNLVPVTKSGEQLSFTFQAFRENRLPFTIRVKDTHQEPMGRVAFMREPRVGRGEPPQTPICNLNIVLPEPDLTPVSELVTLEKKYGFVQETSLAKPELIHRADLRLSDIAKELGNDWIPLALQLDLPESDINSIRSENPNDTTQQALVMLRHWLHKSGSKATGNLLEKGLRKINREDIVNQCMFNVELVTDDVEKAVAKVHLDQSGFDTFKEELGSSRDASLRRDASLNGTFDEQDIMKEAESAAETSSESSDKEGHFRSETRHSDKASKRTAEAVSHSANKSFEEGPETLVQNIPSALSETCPQNMSNGQVSDASVHEDDKSELTAATLSSEATAEMEVSSLEDKSQTETHVEKKEWTETDESGCVRQVTVVKTETSINFEEKATPAQVHPVEETSSIEMLEPRNLDQIKDTHVYSEYEDETFRKMSVELCRKDELHEAIKLDEDDSFEGRPGGDRPSNLATISSVVDNLIKSEILQEEIDQSIEESPLEVKQIVEDLQKISDSEDHKCNVYKQIRTEIFSQELGADIESGSPERKELGAFSLKKSDSLSDISGEKLEHEPSASSEYGIKDAFDDTDSCPRAFRKSISPQISEDSCGPTDDISSEGVVVEPDEHLVDYDEAKDEHSLTEQLQALASDSKNLIIDPLLQSLDFGTQEFEHISSGMSSSLSDLEVHRRAKDITYSRHDKKEIRSLKSTKQVSTIEEHSSIESCDSSQDLGLHDLPEKYDPKNDSDEDDDNDEDGKGMVVIKTCDVVKDGDLKRASEDIEQKTSPEDEKLSGLPTDSDLEPNLLQRHSDSTPETSKMSRSDSKSSHSKKSDSDAEGSKIDSAGESSGKRKEESCSSSGDTESPYYSVETSDSGRTPRSTPAASRPCSSEFDINVFSGHGSEYETCVTSQEASGEASGSYATAVSSQEISYATACSSFSHSSRESAYSVDSESSGHLASVEVSSEASETLVPSAQEMELEFAPDLEMPVLDEEPAVDDSVREPYDMDIPEAIIRGGIEMPFMTSWDFTEPAENEKMKQLPQQWKWQFAAESEVSDKFEVLESDDTVEDSKFIKASVADTQQDNSCANKAKSEDTKHFYPQVGSSSSHSGPFHRRSVSSVVDIIPDKEHIEPIPIPLEEEQLSVSESSATHSEQTWQTSSIDTAVQLSSSHAPASDASNILLDSFQETPPEKELTAELDHSSNQDSSYLQLNGPIEVDYNPDYDNPDADSELNQNQSSNAYEAEGLQFDLEMEGASAINSNAGESPSNVHADSENVQFELGSNQSLIVDNQCAQLSGDYESPSTVDADKPEAQQQQSLSFRNYELRESESRVCSDLTSYLPESDQCELLPEGMESLPPSFESEINIPCAESVSSSEGVSNLETRSNLLSDLVNADSLEKADAVDTSPEDERYDYKSMKPITKSPKEENSDILNPESDYASQQFASKYDEVPGTDLYTHQEEEEFDIRETYLSPIPSVEEDKQSTPSSEAFHGRRFFPRSSDTSAASSLQEFERLEAEIAAGRISRSSIDSSEKVVVTKSGEHDDVSMSSLTEFEKLEKECTEAIIDNKTAAEDIMMLSEIEEGLESQCSDVIEILHESLHEGSDSSEYERRRVDIEEIIKVAQVNVERFQEETVSEGATSEECTTVLVKVLSDAQDSSELTKGSSKEDGNTDFEESENLPLTLENDSTTGGHDSSSSGEKFCGNEKLDCMVSSTDSMDPSSSTATHATYQFETDSVMSSSLNSAQASGEECTMVSSTDTLEPEPKITYSHGDSETEEKTHLCSRTEETIALSSKGALEYKLKELQSTNGAKQQMEMFLSKLTDESVLMDDFASHSFPDILDESEQQTAPDDFTQTFEAAHGVSSSGDGEALDSDDLVSSTTTTTTTRVVTSVISDPDVQSEVESSFVQQLSGDDIRQSCEITFSDTVHDTSRPDE
ncbi:ankyrin-1-like isoform X13 [Argiope bruennichi]|uniref:ankyrin-1-like isoform X13 n=1 Tax=Argiope bruennichi TaxID=94029 RepID=UPI0024945D9E|nr:ankyrin-1-like isoform X13 [Argiope bruennichi]